jgi:NUBPL iron-transfer P-loop NTPase
LTLGIAGTSDEHLSLMEHLAPVHHKLSAVLVTTPQAVALTDMAKCLSFTRTVNLPVIGLIENMSGFVCPCCGEISNVFSTGGGEEMAKREGLRFLGALPVDMELVELLDASVEAEALAEHGADQQTVAARETANGKIEDRPITNNHPRENDMKFPLLKGYHKTSTFKLFEPIAGKVVSVLTEESVPPIRGT